MNSNQKFLQPFKDVDVNTIDIICIGQEMLDHKMMGDYLVKEGTELLMLQNPNKQINTTITACSLI